MLFETPDESDWSGQLRLEAQRYRTPGEMKMALERVLQLTFTLGDGPVARVAYVTGVRVLCEADGALLGR